MLKDVLFNKRDIEKVVISNTTFYIIYPEKVVVDTNFEIITDLSEITSTLNKADIKTLLVHKVEDIIKDCCDDDYDDDYEEDDDYYDDEEL